jgi:3-hydroxyacyl-CoA dehydrogenase
MEIRKVGVLGCGLMGAGIAQVAASAGYQTIVKEVSEEFINKGFGGIEKSLAKFAEKGRHRLNRWPIATSLSKPSSRIWKRSAARTSSLTLCVNPKRYLRRILRHFRSPR